MPSPMVVVASASLVAAVSCGSGPTVDHGGQLVSNEGRIAFTHDKARGGSGQIYVINADGSGLTKLTDAPAGSHDAFPAWQPKSGKKGSLP